MIIEIIILILTTAIAYCYYSHRKILSYFEKNGIKYVPGFPMVGNTLKSMMMKRHPIEDLDAVYKAFPDERYVGYIEGHFKAIMIRDPELVKAITVKNFDQFVNRRPFLPEESDPLFGGSLFMMQGDRWRDMRTTLSPAFTGSKLRHMMPFMIDISQNIVDHIKEKGSEVIDAADLMKRYSNDVIASTAFGLQVNSLKDPDNEFYKTGQNLFKMSFWMRLQFMFFILFPEVYKKVCKRVLFPEEVVNFFRNLVSSTIEHRTANNIKRPDMIQLLIDASQGNLNHEERQQEDSVGFATTEEMLKPRESSRKWTLDQLTAQVFLFFAAGFESVASTLTLCIHELALHPDAQEKLYQELREFQEKYGKLTYDTVVELKYLDCVLNESMRKFSAAIILDRVCLKDFELPPPRDGAKSLTLKSGDSVYMPVHSYHRDPKYFSEPEKFNPDRFLDENKDNIKPFTFMPFGSGPRNCIGSRFALLELKVLMYNLILNYKIVKCEKTSDPITLLPAEFNLRAVGGTFVKFEARK